MGNRRNPFSLEAVRDNRPASFPTPPVQDLTRAERKIVTKAREDAIAMGYQKAKGELGVQAIAELEEFVSTRFNGTALRMHRRLEDVLTEINDEQVRDLFIVFTVENMIRMGAAMTGVADAAEGAIRELVERKLITDEQQSMLAALFRGRR